MPGIIARFREGEGESEGMGVNQVREAGDVGLETLLDDEQARFFSF